MACGDPYIDAFTTIGPRSADNPCDGLAWCNETDVAAWRVQASHVFDLVRTAWNTLKAQEHATCPPAPCDYSRSDALEANVLAYENAWAKLPDASILDAFQYAFGGGGAADADIGRFMSNIAVGACQLDLLNQALADIGALGITPGPGLGTGGTGEGPLGLSWLTWAVAGALLVGGVYALGRWG